jgi:hypothetical protein
MRRVRRYTTRLTRRAPIVSDLFESRASAGTAAYYMNSIRSRKLQWTKLSPPCGCWSRAQPVRQSNGSHAKSDD